MQYRPSSLPLRWGAVLAPLRFVCAVWGLSACVGAEDKPPGSLDWSVNFACEEDRANSDQLRLIMRKNDCKGAAVYDELLLHGDEAPAAPPLKPGIYGFQAIALREGEPLAKSCVLAALPPRTKLSLLLASEACLSNVDAGNFEEDDASVPSQEPSTMDAGVTAPSKPLDMVVDSSAPAPTPEAGAVVPADCASDGVAQTSCGECGRVCAAGQTCENGACKPPLARGATCTAQRFRDHDYLFCEDKRTWSSARKMCRDMGFGLVSIEDHAEDVFVQRFAGKVDRWIGANDIGVNDIGVNDIDIGVDDFGLGNVASSCAKVAGPVGEGNWYWASKRAEVSNETPICARANASTKECTPTEGRYQNFNRGEPENATCTCLGVCLPGEDCGMLLAATGLWSDRACLTFVSYVCESP